MTVIVAVLLPDVVDDCVAEVSDDVDVTVAEVVTDVTVVVTVSEVVTDDVAVVVADVVNTLVVADDGAVVVLEAAVMAGGQVPAWMSHSPTVSSQQQNLWSELEVAQVDADGLLDMAHKSASFTLMGSSPATGLAPGTLPPQALFIPSHSLADAGGGLKEG